MGGGAVTIGPLAPYYPSIGEKRWNCCSSGFNYRDYRIAEILNPFNHIFGKIDGQLFKKKIAGLSQN